MTENSPSQDIASWVKAMDRCWLEHRFADLENYLAQDVVFVAPNGHRAFGRDTAIEGYREFMGRAQIRRFQPGDPVVTQRGDTAVVEYDWDMAWESGGESYEAKGRDILVLSCSADVWSVIWRTQLSA